jgi:putative oxidoreductase
MIRMNTLEQPLRLDLSEYGRLQLLSNKSSRVRQLIFSIVELMVRIYLAYVFFNMGSKHFLNWGETLQFFSTEFHVPSMDPIWLSLVVSAGEICFSGLLLLGLWSRLSAWALFLINSVLSYSLVGDVTLSSIDLRDHWHWGLLLLLLMTTNRGDLSLDGVRESSFKIYKYFGRNIG